MEFARDSRWREIALNIFSQNVGFQIDGIAGNAIADIGVFVGVGNHRNFGDAIVPARNGQADAIDGDGAFGNDVARQVRWNFDSVDPTVAVRREVRNAAGAIHVTENKMAAEFFSGGKWLFEIYARASFQRCERSLGDRLAGKIGGKMFRCRAERPSGSSR